MKVAIVKYNAGNTQSVIYALNRLGIEPVLTSDAEELNRADKVIFPGVGEASTAMNFLKQNGLVEIIKNLKQPTLGICLGMQLLGRHSEENNTDCLGIIPVDIKRFPDQKGMKVPQIGWNTLQDLKGPLFKGMKDGEFVYFVHSYYVAQSEFTIATTNYILPYASAMHKDNFYAVQFHPEKSSKTGEKIIQNFLEL